MNHLDRTAAALEEVNPPVAAAIRAAGCNGLGMALPGLLGWLPTRDLTQLVLACWLAAGSRFPYPYEDHVQMASVMRWSAWREPRSDEEEAAVHEALLVWSRISGRVPMVDLLEVKSGRALS